MLISLADLVLVIHFLFIAFVVLGQVGIIMGAFWKWQWVRNNAFRICHLAAVGLVVVQTWLGQWCPLTVLENHLRISVGEEPYAESFIQYWLGTLIYYDLPGWVFFTAYTLFGGLVLGSWFWVRPTR